MKLKNEYRGLTITIRTGRIEQTIKPEELTKLDLYNYAVQGMDFSYMFHKEEKKKYKGLNERRKNDEGSVDEPSDKRD